MKKNMKIILSSFAISSAIVATPIILKSNTLEQKHENNHHSLFSSSNTINLYKENDFAFKKKLPSIIQWHQIYNNSSRKTNQIKIDTQLNQYGAILQYKNGVNWKHISKNGIIENLNSSPIYFRWSNDSSHKSRAFDIGDGSGNIYNQQQLDMFGVVKAAPAGVRAGEIVTQANIDKRNGHTITGLEIPESLNQPNKDIVLFDQKPFGIEEDNNNNEGMVWNQDKDRTKFQKNIEVNKGFLINGHSLKLSFKIYAVKEGMVNPTLDILEKDISRDGLKYSTSYLGNLIISYNKINKEIHYKLAYKYLSPHEAKNDEQVYKQKINTKFNKMNFIGYNINSKTSTSGLDLEIQEKNKNTLNFKINYLFGNNKGEDATYFKKIKLETSSPTNDQILAAKANFKARDNDKIGYKYTNDEIWMRDYGSKLSEASILGLNKKDIFSKKVSTIILLNPTSTIQSSDINNQIQKAVSDKNNKFFLDKLYGNNELIATDELLSLDSDIVSVLPNQSLHNGLNHIAVKTMDGFVFEDGKFTKIMTIDIKDKFYSVISLLNFNSRIFHKDDSVFSINNQLLGINSKEFKVAPKTKVARGINQIKLIAEKGFIFANHKKSKKINIEVVKNGKTQIDKQIEYFKNKIKDAKVTNQNWFYLFEISRNINGANNINKKLEIIKKISGVDLPLKKDDTQIVDIVAYTAEDQLILEFHIYATQAIIAVTNNTFKAVLKGKGNQIIADHFHKKNFTVLDNALKGLKIKHEKQAYRLLGDIATTIIDIDSLSNFLDLNLQSIIKGSNLKNIYAIADKGIMFVTGVLNTPFALKDTPFKYSFNGGKVDSKINDKIDLFNQLQKKDAAIIKKSINDQLEKINIYPEMYNNTKMNSYKSKKLESISSVHSLKENLGIDLNVDLKASIIRKVSLFKNSKDDLVLDVLLYTHKASKNNMIVDYVIKKHDETQEHSKAYNILIIIVSILVPTLIIMALFYFSNLKKHRYE